MANREELSVKVKLDRNLYIGVSNCLAIAPTVFKLDEESKAVVLDPSSVKDQTLLEAAESCPQDAILEHIEGNRKKLGI